MLSCQEGWQICEDDRSQDRQIWLESDLYCAIRGIESRKIHSRHWKAHFRSPEWRIESLKLSLQQDSCIPWKETRQGYEDHGQDQKSRWWCWLVCFFARVDNLLLWTTGGKVLSALRRDIDEDIELFERNDPADFDEGLFARFSNEDLYARFPYDFADQNVE